jgi:hypothetical protein
MSDHSFEGPTAGEGPRQYEIPRREELIRFNGVGGGSGGTVRFRMLVPDGRLICKVTLIGTALQTAPGSAILAGKGLLLWLFAADEDQRKGGVYTPVTDLAGSTQAAPIPLPANAALGGFSREFITSADAIEGEITVPAALAGSPKGSLFLQARWQPANFRLMPWSEWDEVRRQCKIAPLDDLLVIP